ncbi:hypothetical protein PUNSTDRAFT_112307 [Punctularia strigosozonata HHB-11173 SS5]|uniref:uncharacterized protein n=1 Tax=Punctularia strigosozonata (strain HHB-11173) TaxID=741275 RepID=UPI00044178EE|nr:uncharacterized protein PUNSTDRAFT_112307 [Punctularia strigosozonata HHB-11173 SS5]EIN10455.1 hypothetical protein PUNSTDRAFT_112307 [Punctularia strigosozonata HHB-11173 SS5]
MSDPIPVVHGYYRSSDIFWEWHQVLPNPEDIHPLKALTSYEALVHPDHPLRKEGQDGIELYYGTLANGEGRLLFSSAQIEYIRYWLHAMGLTKEPIPIPHSKCLLTLENDLASVSPWIYKDSDTLKRATKDIEKNNKRLRNAVPLISNRLTFEKVRSYWAGKSGTWCAIDFEGWEMEHALITEVGWSYARWHNGKRDESHSHLIVEEALGYTNGKYVPENRKNYTFGESEYVTRSRMKERVKSLLKDLSSNGPLYLVFHDANQDIKYLQKIFGDAYPDLVYTLPELPPDDGIYVVDTAVLFSALEGDAGNKRSLERMCRLLGIETHYLHNAGNDAHYTFMALMQMASGDPLDAQREKRWPKHTEAPSAQGGPGGLRVQFKPHEESGDASDMEGVAPPCYDPETGYLRGYGPPPDDVTTLPELKVTEDDEPAPVETLA